MSEYVRPTTPVYDLRELRSRLVQLLDDVDRIAEQLANPREVPDLTDHRAPLTYGGTRYRVVGGVFGATDRPALHLVRDSEAGEGP